MDPTTRFDDRVDLYARYRPAYPASALDHLFDAGLVVPGDRVADVGAGTGILTRQLLGRDLVVDAVEPGGPMRRRAEADLGAVPGFRSVDGTAECTTLADASVRLVVAAQAFHWFERDACRREFARILRPGGHVAVLWNRRPVTGAFAGDYEAFVTECSRDYSGVTHRRLDDDLVAAFFAPANCHRECFPNAESLTFDELRGRLLSSSYMPLAGEPGHDEAMRRLDVLFETHAVSGRVTFDYATHVYWGRLE